MAHSASNMSFMSGDSQGGHGSSQEDLLALQEDIGRWGKVFSVLSQIHLYISQTSINNTPSNPL